MTKSRFQTSKGEREREQRRRRTEKATVGDNDGDGKGERERERAAASSKRVEEASSVRLRRTARRRLSVGDLLLGEAINRSEGHAAPCRPGDALKTMALIQFV